MVHPTDPTGGAPNIQAMGQNDLPAERAGCFGGMNFMPDFSRMLSRMPSMQDILSRLGFSRAEPRTYDFDDIGPPQNTTRNSNPLGTAAQQNGIQPAGGEEPFVDNFYEGFDANRNSGFTLTTRSSVGSRDSQLMETARPANSLRVEGQDAEMRLNQTMQTANSAVEQGVVEAD